MEISDLFSGKKQYKIPRYQRCYVWDDTNWETLWQDIVQLPKKHFTGTIITYTEKTKEDDENQDVVEIVDGQQRITTFQIIFCIFRDLFNIIHELDSKTHGKTTNRLEYYRNKVNGYIELSDPVNRLITTRSDDGLAFKFVMDKKHCDTTNEDLKSVIDEYKQKIEKSTLQNQIISAYLYFVDKISSYMLENGQSGLIELLECMTGKFRMVYIELDSDEDPEKIFQTINDTGRMLTDFDYLRNYLFLRTRKHLKIQPSDDLYDKYWNRFEEWDIQELESFFRIFLESKLGPECFNDQNKTKPFDCYRKHIKKLEGEEQVVVPLLQLNRYAESYDTLYTTSEFEDKKHTDYPENRLQFYIDLELPRLDSFLLFMKHTINSPDFKLPSKIDNDNLEDILSHYQDHYKNEGIISNKELNNLLNTLESFIMRRWLCDNRYEDSYHIINNFFVNNLNQITSLEDFYSFLSYKWPDPNEVNQILKSRVASINSKLLLYILYRVNPWDRKQDPSLKNGTFSPLISDNLTLEIIMKRDELLKIEINKGNGSDEVITLEKTRTLNREISEAVDSIGNFRRSTVYIEPNLGLENINERTINIIEKFNQIWKSDIDEISKTN